MSAISIIRAKKFAARAAICAVFVALAGCTFFEKPEVRPCAQVRKLKDASKIVQYRDGKGRDIIDVRYEAEIGAIRAACEYDDDVLEMTVAIDIKALKGPAGEERQAKFPFFIAIIDAKQNILAKEVFVSTVSFPPGRRRGRISEETTQVIPIPGGKTGADFAILVGFQLTGEQLSINRRRLGQR